jgi:hypothetical protein
MVSVPVTVKKKGFEVEGDRFETVKTLVGCRVVGGG